MYRGAPFQAVRGAADGENSPLALAGVENKGLVVLGVDCELVLRRVEDVEQKVTLPGAAQDTRTHISTTPFGPSCKDGVKRAHLPCSHTCIYKNVNMAASSTGEMM